MLGVKFQPRAPTPGKPQKSAPVRTRLQKTAGRLPKLQNQKLGNGAFSTSHCRRMTKNGRLCSSFGPNLEREGFRAFSHICTPVRTRLPKIVCFDAGRLPRSSGRLLFVLEAFPVFCAPSRTGSNILAPKSGKASVWYVGYYNKGS